MAQARRLPDTDELVRMIQQGWTDPQIAERYGVKRQAVQKAVRGKMPARRNTIDWPWDIEPRHRSGMLYDGLYAWLIDRQASRPLSNRERVHLGQLQDLIGPRDYVVTYSPHTAAGLALRPRNGEPKNTVVAFD